MSAAVAFFQSINAIPIDARYGGMPVAIASDIMGKPKRQPKPKSPKMDWENCRALAKAMGVLIGYNRIEFPQTGGEFVTTSSFENGKSYSYKHSSPNQCYEQLLSLHRDRLSRMSDEELQAASAIAAGDLL